MGEDPVGCAIFSQEGWMSAQLTAGGRPNLSGPDPRQSALSELASAFLSYVAYAGRYHVDSSRLVTQVVVSLNPGWVGGEQVRFWEMEGETLLLRTPPFLVAGTVMTLELRWERVIQ